MKAPKIRFPGFTDAWEQRKLGELSSTTIGEFVIKTKQDPNSPYPVFNGGVSNTGFYSEYNNDGDHILISARGANAGFVNIYKGKYWAGNSCYSVFINEPSKQNIDFIYQEMKRNQHLFTDYQQSASIPAVSKADVEKFRIQFPSINEQQQIGAFFKNFDDLITIHQRKLDDIKLVKQSLLQKMFPKNGEDIPEIRFPGFTDTWEQRKLGDISDITGGGTPSTSIPEYWDGDIDWYAPAEIGEQIFVNSSKRKISKEGLENSSAKILPVGTVLYTSRAGIGNTAILAKEGCTNQGFQSIIPHQNQLDSYFVYSMSNQLKRYGEIKGAGSTFVEVSGKQMSKMELMIPSMNEQQQIGTFFKNLDDLITLHQRKLDNLKQLKQAMLQQMFI